MKKPKIKGTSYLIGRELASTDQSEISDSDYREIMSSYVDDDDMEVGDDIYFYEAKHPYNTAKKRDELINVLMKYSTVFTGIIHDYKEILLDDENLGKIYKITFEKLCDLQHKIYFTKFGCIVHVSDAERLRTIFGDALYL